ncbi:MAG: hypothetical protein U9R34_06795 [Nanoarchaeota archaeon]|nr:hypothetical protein [Nanoarchaeota archaeon]
MALEKKDIDALKALVKKEIEIIDKEGSTILHPGIAFLSTEERYEDYLKDLLKKLKEWKH